jgi:N-acetylneuraminic acid mutarotase/glucose/arabinose dehydrogenase
MMVSYGNHEISLNEGYQFWASRFATPAGFDDRNYSFDIGDAHFISIFAVENTAGLPGATLSWLEQDLASAQASGKRWIIPFFHVSPFTNGTNHPSNVNLRAQLGPLFEQYGVKIALSSHDQAYERSYPLMGVPSVIQPTTLRQRCFAMSDGVTWLKVSPGGKLSDISRSFSPFANDVWPSWTAVRSNTTHAFARVRVRASGSLRVEVYGLVGDGSQPALIDWFDYGSTSCSEELFFERPSLGFVADQGGAPATQTLLLQATGGNAPSVTVSESATWLSVAPSSTSIPQSIAFTADPGGLSPGVYRTKVQASASGYATAAVEVTLRVKDQSTSSTHQLLLSLAPNRSNPVPLEGSTVDGPIHVFVSPTSGLNRVRFFLDDPNMVGAPRQTENSQPFDFAGTASNGTAVAFNATALATGTHSITAAIDRTDGTSGVVHGVFTVSGQKRLLFDPATTSFSLSAGTQATQPIALSASDIMATAYSLTSSASWLTATPVTGSTPASVQVTANSTGLAAGTYNGTVTANAAGYLSGTLAVSLVVGSAPTAEYELRVSNLPDRSQSAGLSGATVLGSIYVFTTPTSSGVSQVRFYLDDPLRSGTPFRIENGAPHDFAGTASDGDALPFDTKTLANGTHNITAAVVKASGATVIVSANVTVNNPTQVSLCNPVPCDQIRVDLPYSMDFTQNHGQILDKNGVGTGFTYIDWPSNSGGYKPANLNVDLNAGTLQIATTKGIASTTANNQDNALGVGVNAPSQVTRVSTVLVNPPAGTGRYEQAGLWFGNDDQNYVKHVVQSVSGGTRLEFLMEVGGVQVQAFQSAKLNLSSARVSLVLRADPVARRIAASYSVNGGTVTTLGSVTAPPEFFSFDGARINPEIGTDTFTGIFATHRNASTPLIYTFDEFQVEVDASSPPPVDAQGFVKNSFPVVKPTSMAWGPDDRLYVTELFGRIHAFSFAETKQPTADQVITALTDSLGSRMTLGITIDPLSTGDNVVLWVSHSSPSLENGEPNSGTVTRLSGPNFQTVEHVITGLPRAIANHGLNSLHFGPDGRLYIAAGGNTGAGAPNTGSSEFGDMEEQPLSAAVLVADVRDPDFDGSCHNSEDIFGAPPCDVVPYATGFRNAYDFVFHSNGSMYLPDNGLGVTGTFPPSPTSPCFGLASTTSWTSGGHNPGEQPDLLYRVAPGRYHGHPNPSRNECVFKDGSWQGVAAPPNYTPPIFTLGLNKSADGMVEYTHNPFFGALKNELLVVNYSVGDDITRIRLSADGNSVVDASTLAGGFNDPLPITVGPDGTIYVGELGGDRVTPMDPHFGRWFSGESMSFARHELGIASIDSRVYAIGGNVGSPAARKVEEYNTTTKTWRTMADLPEGLDHIGVAVVNGKIYVLGGLSSFPGTVSSDVYEFDPTIGPTGQWTKISDMPRPVGGAAVGSDNGWIYVAGGFTTHHDVSLTSDNFWRFDPVGRTWEQLPDIPTYRDHTRGEFINGKFHVVGGRQDGQLHGRLGTLEVYDPAAQTWSPLLDMPTPRRGISSAVLEGKLVVFGGEKNPDTQTEVFNEVEEFDPATGRWRNLAPMPTPRHTAGAVTINNRVYVVGGATVQGGTDLTNLMEIFTFANKR